MLYKRLWYGLSILPIIATIFLVMQYGMSEYPYADTTIANARTALRVAEGTFTLDDLFVPHYRHRTVFTQATTALLTVVNQWDVRYEIWLNVALGVINCGLIALLLWRFWGKFAPMMLFITTFLMMNLDQALNWLSGLQSSWHFVTLFSLLALLSASHNTVRGFFFAVMFACFASLALGNGITIWFALIIFLWLRGNRTWWQYGVLISVGGIITLSVFMGGLQIEGNSYQPFQFTHIPEMFYLWGLMLGRPIVNVLSYAQIPNTPQVVYFAVAQDTGLPLVPAGIGLALLIYATWHLVKRQKAHVFALPIVIILYTWAGLAMIAFTTVLQSLTAHIDNAVLALTERYMPLSLLFWLMVFGMIASAWQTIARPHKRIIALMIVPIITLHVTTLLNDIPYISFNELAFPLDDSRANGQCAEQYPLTTDRTCIYAIWMTDWHHLDQLALAQLAGYTKLPKQTILPYWSQGDAIVLNGQTASQTLYLQHYFFADIPDEAIFRIAPDRADTTGLEAFLADKTGIWYIIRPPLYQGEAMPTIRQAMVGIDARHIITPENIQLTRYIRPFADAQTTVAQFEEDIILVAWQFIHPPQACETVILQTAWRVDVPQSQTIHLSFALVDNPITRAIENADAPISPIPIQFWEVDRVYYDERALTLPCEIDVNSYQFTMTLYGVGENGAVLPNLPVMSDTLPIDGHLLIIR